MEPPSKRIKLDTAKLLGRRTLTEAHVRAVLDALPRDLEFESVNKSFDRAAEDAFDADVAMTVELPKNDGTTFSWQLARPQALLRKMVSASSSLKRIMSKADGSAQPWRLVFNLDEVTPGNIAAPTNYRKFVAFYFTFAEFGAQLIRNQDFWFQTAILRSSIVKEIPGGLSTIMKEFLKTFVEGREAFNTQGVAIDAANGPFLFYAVPSRLVADGAALSAVFDANSAAATKPCFWCTNVLKPGTFEDQLDGFVDTTCTDTAKIILHTDKSIWRTFDDLAALKPRNNKTTFQRIQQSYGFKHNPRGLLMDLELRRIIRPLEFHTADWPHIYLQHGVANIEMWHLLRRLKLKISLLQDDVRSWKWPASISHLGKMAWQAFTDRRKESSASEHYWKCSISELMLICPIVLHHARTAAGNGFDAEVASFEKLCYILDLIRTMKHGNFGNNLVAFRQATLTHLRGLIDLYGSDIVTPKMHVAAVHLADQFERDQVVWDTLPMERAHQIPKQIGTVVKNLRCYEKTIVARMIAHQRSALEAFDERPGLRGSSAALHGLKLAKGMYYHGLRVAPGDVLQAHDGKLVQVACCGERNGDLFVLAYVCNCINRRRGYARVRCNAEFTMFWMQAWLRNRRLSVLSLAFKHVRLNSLSFKPCSMFYVGTHD